MDIKELYLVKHKDPSIESKVFSSQEEAIESLEDSIIEENWTQQQIRGWLYKCICSSGNNIIIKRQVFR